MPLYSLQVGSDRFVLQCTECPGGYILKQSLSSGLRCECEDAEYVLHCEDDQDSVLIKVYTYNDNRYQNATIYFPLISNHPMHDDRYRISFCLL